MRTSRRLSVGALGVLCACGGGSHTGEPTSPSAATRTAVPAGTALVVVDGETGGPVAQARVSIDERVYQTDAAGGLRLTEAALLGSRVGIEAAGFLPRRTALRSAGQDSLSLWPRAGRSGFDETLIRELVYTDAGTCCEPGSSPDARAPLLRMRTGTVATVALPASLQGTPAAGAIGDAIDGINDAAEGLVTFRLSGTSQGDVRVEIVPTGTTPDGRPAGAYFAADRQGMWITGGRLVLSRADFGRLPEVGPGESETLWYLTSLFAHELAHCLGLQHSSVVGLMGPVWSATYAGLPSPENLVPARLTPAERALLHLSYQREAGNLFPDDDPAVASSARNGSPVMCVIPPRP